MASAYVRYPSSTTINGLSGAVTLAAGTNITLTPSGNTITIASSLIPTFPLLAPDGSAAAPPYSFTSSTNSGMFFGSSAVQFAYGGIVVVQYNATSFGITQALNVTGQVSLASFVGTPLISQVSNSGAGQQFILQNSSNTAGSYAQMSVRNGGNSGAAATTGYVGGTNQWSVGVTGIGDTLFFNNSYGLTGANLGSITTGGVWTIGTGTSSTHVINGSISTSGTATAIKGTATNDSAAAGVIGEILTQSRLRSAATAMTTATALNVTASALSLTAGDWDVEAEIGITPGATTSITIVDVSISTTTATLSATDTTAVADANGQIRSKYSIAANVPGANDLTFQTIRSRVSIASTTSYFLVAQAAFTVSTLSVYGSIRARRVR